MNFSTNAADKLSPPRLIDSRAYRILKAMKSIFDFVAGAREVALAGLQDRRARGVGVAPPGFRRAVEDKRLVRGGCHLRVTRYVGRPALSFENDSGFLS